MASRRPRSRSRALDGGHLLVGRVALALHVGAEQRAGRSPVPAGAGASGRRECRQGEGRCGPLPATDVDRRHTGHEHDEGGNWCAGGTKRGKRKSHSFHPERYRDHGQWQQRPARSPRSSTPGVVFGLTLHPVDVAVGVEPVEAGHVA